MSISTLSLPQPNLFQAENHSTVGQDTNQSILLLLKVLNFNTFHSCETTVFFSYISFSLYYVLVLSYPFTQFMTLNFTDVCVFHRGFDKNSKHDQLYNKCPTTKSKPLLLSYIHLTYFFCHFNSLQKMHHQCNHKENVFVSFSLCL